MIFFLRHRDKEYTVRVESRNQQTFVKFGDEPERPVDIGFDHNDVTFLDENKVFNANIVGEKSDYTIWRPEGNVQFTVESEYKRIIALLRGQEVGSTNNVYAKMPGKIVKISTKVGDTVEKNQSLMVMEAMKMENEIRSGIAGKIGSISVKEGQAVETGALLIEMIPEDVSN